jgi:hemerythrin-like domain-containing protein/nucleotide-binding universal stress UspA family protein
MYTNILVPTDGTALGVETVQRAAHLAKALGACLTFFHAARDPSKSIIGDPALLHAIDPDRYAARYEWRNKAVLWKAEAEAIAVGVPFRSVAVTGGPAVAEAIIAAAVQNRCDLIFMASHGRSNSLSRMLGSVAFKVLVHSPLLVLLSDSGIHPPSAMTRALALMHEEHCIVSAMLRGLGYLVDQARQADEMPDFGVIRAVLAYLNDFCSELHHPKEEDYLFSRMQVRGYRGEAVLSDLCRQHKEEKRLLGRLESALDAAQKNRAAGMDELAAAMADFGRHVKVHMDMEEGVVIPAARDYLDESDWLELDRAFAENGDPRFGAASDEEFRVVFAQIVSRFPQPGTLDPAAP